MKIIISPAKKMKVDIDSYPWRDYPAFLEKTRELCRIMQCMSPDELKKLWKCNDRIAQINLSRLQTMNLEERLTPAVLSYEGIQYRYMSPGVFTEQELEYIQTHLRILSGFYGLLKPFDGVTPYRLEMQTKLKTEHAEDLYAYWSSSIAEVLFAETDCIINLASKEYSICVSKYKPEKSRLVTCVFGEEQNNRVVEKGTLCKMARGEMVRFMAENQIEDPEQIKAFDRLGYQFRKDCSDENTFVFVRNETGV